MSAALTRQPQPVVLLIDDTEAVRRRVRKRLERAMRGIRVAEAANPQKAMCLLDSLITKGANLKLIVVDLLMPLTNASAPVSPDRLHTAPLAGQEMLKLISHFRLKTSACRIIVFTAYPSYERCVQAIKAGADDFIPKTDIEHAATRGGQDAGTIDEANCEKLIRRCTECITKAVGDVLPHEKAFAEWHKVNSKWLENRFTNTFVAVISSDTAEAANLPNIGTNQRDGYYVISGDSYEDVQHKVFTLPDVYSSLPLIMFISK